MSYPINQAITYTAMAATSGLPLDTFTYTWAFDDSTAGSGNTLTHTWTTGGGHTASVTATDNQTGGTATASKAINVTSYIWTPKTAQPKPFSHIHRTITLPDGDVLLLDDTDSTAYRYNVTLNSWSSTTAMPVSGNVLGNYGEFMIFNLPSGKILVPSVNGFNGSEIFNPVGDTWSPGPVMKNSGAGSQSLVGITLWDGRIFTYSYGGALSWFVQIYDEHLNTWVRKTSPSGTPPNSGSYSIVQLDSDRVLVMGAFGGNNSMNSYIYSLSGDSWTTTTIPPSSTYNSMMCQPINRGDGYIYLIGYTSGGTGVNRLSAKYSILGGAWTALTGKTLSVGYQDFVGRFLLAGKSRVLCVGYRNSYTYDIQTDTYSAETPDYTTDINLHNATYALLNDGRPMIFNGNSTNCQVFEGS